MKKLAVSLMLLLTLVHPLNAFAIDTLNYEWTAPTTGTVVHHYDVQIMVDGQVIDTITPDNVAAFTYTQYAEGTEITIRVRGVDASNRTGVWSQWSDLFRDDGPPGACGKPSWTTG